MIFRLANLLLFLLLSLSCTHKKNTPQSPDVLAIKELSELATAEYVVTKIIKANDDKTWFKLGDRKILISCQATITAGIDLSKISEKDIIAEDKSVDLVLPHAKVISLNIRPEDLKIEYEDVSVFRSAYTSAERDALAAQGEKAIMQSINSLGILQTAEINAGLVLTNFLRSFGYEKINIHFNATPAKALQ